jgi:thiamine biosynthesis lipoprotein
MSSPFPITLAALVFLASAGPLGVCSAARAETVEEVRIKMGSRFELTVVADDGAEARRALERAWSEIDRLEAMISSWSESSETAEINRRAGERPVVVSPELFGLVARSLKVAELTGGAFDPTFAALSGLWDFKSPTPAIPSAEAIRSALEKVGTSHVELDREARTVYLTEPGVRLGFGAIGKGFAANSTVRLLRSLGIESGVVSAGGDLFAFGRREDGTPWRVGIADPRDEERSFATLLVSEQAVATSGDYESFFELDGQRYSHILDPHTGWPVQEVRSATVICADAELADALATAISVMGIEQGLRLIDRLQGIEALMVDGEGRMHFSANLRSQLESVEESE